MGDFLKQVQGATQDATQAPQLTTLRPQGGGYTTTAGENFNYTTPNAPYWGTYVDSVQPTSTSQTSSNSQENDFNDFNNVFGNKGGQVFYDPQRGQYYTQNTSPMGYMFGGGNRNYIGSSKKGHKESGDSFDNQTIIPSYSTYIPPSEMPNINAYLGDPNSLLGAMKDAGVPIAGAGRYASLLSTNTKGK
jgi:hypothetical protein